MYKKNYSEYANWYWGVKMFRVTLSIQLIEEREIIGIYKKKKGHKYYLQNPLAFLQDKETGCECDQTLFR